MPFYGKYPAHRNNRANCVLHHIFGVQGNPKTPKKEQQQHPTFFPSCDAPGTGKFRSKPEFPRNDAETKCPDTNEPERDTNKEPVEDEQQREQQPGQDTVEHEIKVEIIDDDDFPPTLPLPRFIPLQRPLPFMFKKRTNPNMQKPTTIVLKIKNLTVYL